MKRIFASWIRRHQRNLTLGEVWLSLVLVAMAIVATATHWPWAALILMGMAFNSVNAEAEDHIDRVRWALGDAELERDLLASALDEQHGGSSLDYVRGLIFDSHGETVDAVLAYRDKCNREAEEAANHLASGRWLRSVRKRRMPRTSGRSPAR